MTDTPKPLNDPLARARVAVVCDWLTVYAGGEKVLEQILQVVPHDNLYRLVDF